MGVVTHSLTAVYTRTPFCYRCRPVPPTADIDDDIDNDFAESDLEDPSFTYVNDFADLFAAVSLDAKLVG